MMETEEIETEEKEDSYIGKAENIVGLIAGVAVWLGSYIHVHTNPNTKRLFLDFTPDLQLIITVVDVVLLAVLTFIIIVFVFQFFLYIAKGIIQAIENESNKE